METVKKLIEAVKSAKNIVIISHVGPDGDTLGSMFALKEMIQQLSTAEKIDSIIVGKIPDVYRFLPGMNEVKTTDNKELYSSYDLAITVDCGDLGRLGDAINLFRSAKNTINIDHHLSNPNFANINLVIPSASATGHVLYNLIQHFEASLTLNMAINLYTAIFTDTGGFKFDNTHPETLEICANLIRAGVNPSKINKECYESKPLAMVKLHAKAISDSMFVDNNKIAYTSISRKLMQEIGASDDHIDGISEALRQINTVEVAMVFKETAKGDTKVSFRSNGIDICEIAKFFGGGGHKLAAGCTVQKNINDSIAEIIPFVKKQILKTQ